MAKINPVKVKQDADKLEKGGKLDQAIALYRQIVEDNPRDWNTINKIGDLYAKLNKNREASEEYAKVADFYAKDGFLLKAIAIWKKINKLDASALDPYLNLAELYAKQGLMMEAKSQYQIVVDEYIKRGRMREAGDVLKKMADIDPADLKVRSKLADLYTRDGNAAKAVEEHIAIADELTKKGHLAEALQVLEKGLKIDPKGTRLRGELARIHFVQKNYERAAHFLEEAVQHAPSDTQLLAKLGEAYIGGKRIEEAEAIFKRLLELDPNDQESRIQIARVYLLQGQFDEAFEQFVPVADRLLDRREGEKAAALLQQIVQANPSHVKSLVKLVEIYRVLQKESAVAATYSQLTEAYTNEGQWEQAASVLEVLVSMEPQNQQHRNKLQFVRSKLGPVAPAVAPAPVVEEEEFDLSSAAPEPPVFTLGEPPPPAPPTEAPAPVGGIGLRPPIEMTGPLSDEDREFVEEHLAEGKVFRKYGLVDKAADQFESVIARFPDNVDARQELREVYKEKGLNAKAAEQCLTLAEIFRLKGDVAEAEAQDAEAARLAPAAAPAPAKPAPEPAKPAAPPRPAPPTEPIEAVEEEIAVPEAEEEISLDVEEEAPAEETAAEEPAARASQEEAFDLDTEPQSEMQTLDLGGEITGEDLAPQFVEEEPPIPETPLGGIEIGMVPEEEFPLEEPAPPPPPPAPAPLSTAPAKPVVAKPAAPPLRPPVLKAPPPPPILKAPPPPPSPPGLPADLQKVLDEVDSYVSLGFVDDAKDALREVASKHPGHPAILDKISELGLDQEVVQEAAPEAMEEVPEAVEEAGPLDELQLEEPVAAPPAEEPSPLEEALGELGELSLPEPPLEAPEPGFPEPSFLEPAVGEAGLPEVGLPEAELPEMGLPEPEAELPEPELPEVGLPELPEAELPEAELPEVGLPEVGLPEAGPPEAGLAEGGLSDLGLPEPEPVAAAQEGGIDLSAELGELFGAQSAVEEPQVDETSAELGDAGLAEIFKEFKKGVDKQLGKEDYDTRYNLGIAYKEMGLIDEAIAEFQLAAKDGSRLLECSSMLGICFMEKGMPKLAVKWFEKGLKAQGRSDEEYQGLRYDLALAYEAAGEIDKAYSIYTELYGQDANFRDVANKVRELKAALG